MIRLVSELQQADFPQLHCEILPALCWEKPFFWYSSARVRGRAAHQEAPSSNLTSAISSPDGFKQVTDPRPSICNTGIIMLTCLPCKDGNTITNSVLGDVVIAWQLWDRIFLFCTAVKVGGIRKLSTGSLSQMEIAGTHFLVLDGMAQICADVGWAKFSYLHYIAKIATPVNQLFPDKHFLRNHLSNRGRKLWTMISLPSAKLLLASLLKSAG